MAWRIDEHLVRGEIDNRVRGRVTGRLWFVGREDPVVLELEGDGWRDVAGHRLSFVNPEPKPAPQGELDEVAAVQRGVVGDITASRKVKVPDCSRDELKEYYRARKPFPWHWGNSLYLEWISEANGRVVIESASYRIHVEGEPTWAMDEAGEAQQRERNAGALTAFTERLSRLMAEIDPAADGETGLAEEEWDEDTPTTVAEEAAEAEQARMDLLLDRVEARMEREQAEPEDYARILEEERERLRRERGEPEPEPTTPEEAAERAEWVAELNAAADEALGGTEEDADWLNAEDSGREHPLLARWHELHDAVESAVTIGEWLTDDDPPEHPLREVLNGVMLAGAKMAGALVGYEDGDWPPDAALAGSSLVRLKKARRALRDALSGLDAADEENLAEPEWRRTSRDEINAMVDELGRVIAEVRAVLEADADAQDEP